MQRAGGYVVDVGLGHIFGLNLIQHLPVNDHLAVGAILLAAGVYTKPAKLAEEKAQA